MIEAIVQATQIPLATRPAEPFELPQKRLHALIVGGTHLLALANLFPRYAVDATILIPSQIPEVESEMEFRRASQLENVTQSGILGIGIAKDLSGIDTDLIDILIICTIYPGIREEFLAQSWRVVRELGKIVVFTPVELPVTHLASHGIVAPKYFPVEGFYAGIMRKAVAIRARN